MTAANVARYHVVAGRDVCIERVPGATDEEVLTYVTGVVMGALLHQRGVLPLHAGAVVLGDHAVAFSGSGGAGKSTLVAALHRRGHGLLADDVCAVRVDDGPAALAMPGFPHLKLFQESIERVGMGSEELRRILPDLDKYYVCLDDDALGEPGPLTNVLIMNADEQVNVASLTPLTGREKLEALLRATYDHRRLDGHGNRPAHFEMCTRLANQVAVHRLTRPVDWDSMDAVLELVEQTVG